MAQIGLRDFYWNGIASESSNALPTYAGASDTNRGGNLIDLIQANVTITYADGEAYGDDHQIDSVHDFMYADIDTQHFDVPLDVQGKLFGATYSNGVLTEGGSDAAPSIGFGYARTIRKRDGNGQMQTIWRGYFYYKGKAQKPTSESSTTKQGSVTYNYDPVTFRAVEADAGGYREVQDFATEAAYITWITGKLNLS